MDMLVTPIQRNLKFHLPENTVSQWNSAGVHVSQFFNTMSLFFPEGERFFINSVRHYRDRIIEPELLAAVRAFIGQEAMHGREHDEYNQAMINEGFPVDKMEAQVTTLLNLIRENSPPAFQLAITIALEHLTAILADTLLANPELLDKSDPNFTALWTWHALEETEHKAVAYDVFEKVIGTSVQSYLLRTGTLVLATSIFFALCYTYYYQILRTSNEHRNLRGWWQAFKFQWLKPGAMRKAIPAWLDYFRPGFHPWDQDNRGYLQQIDVLIEKVNTFAPAKEQAA
jgi:hypothetical protein